MAKRRKVTQRDPFGHLESEFEEEQDDASPFDERLLKDGRSARVPLYMRDGVTPLQRAVMDSKQRTVITTSNPSMVVDAFGGTAGLSRPGFRYLHAGHKTVDHAVQVSREILRDEAYRACMTRRRADGGRV